MITIILIALWMVFVGAVWAAWISVTLHTLGILTVILGLVVIVLELWPRWQSRNRANP